MYSTILQSLEETKKKYPDKVAFADLSERFTFSQLVENAKKIGSYITKRQDRNNPVVVYMDKKAYNLLAFLGTVYAGCFYVPIDNNMPFERIELILDTLNPKLIIYDDETADKILNIKRNILTVHYREALKHEIDETSLDNIRRKSKSTDLLYVLFTSGSTGIPKGVTISHGAVIDFVEWICTAYNLDETVSLCNQSPFYFDASVPDIYISLKVGATVYIPPASYYTFPKKILQFIEKNEINTLIWVPSALCNVVNCRAFEVCIPATIRLVIFCGEVMPCKHLNIWRKFIPEALYVNMYGPTEATYASMYYNIDREFSDSDKLPLGKACENSEVILLGEDDKAVEDGQTGEICIMGQCLSQGYYNDAERTKAVFIQNPMNNKWIEYMYRTGDLAYRSTDGELIFAGRKDFQIKKSGHRIELGEIENAICSLDGIENACCVFDESKNKIVALYSGQLEQDYIRNVIGSKLQTYMIPDHIIRLHSMPMNLNGKVDRVLLKRKYTEEQMRD